MASITACGWASRVSATSASLNAPFMSKAAPSAVRLIQITAYLPSSDTMSPGAVETRNSGAWANPTTEKPRRNPFMVALMVSPGRNPWARAKLLSSTTSSARSPANIRPSVRKMPFRPGSPKSGSDTARAWIGTSRPGRSTNALPVTRVSTAATPGIWRRSICKRSGARATGAKIPASR